MNGLIMATVLGEVIDTVRQCWSSTTQDFEAKEGPSHPPSIGTSYEESPKEMTRLGFDPRTLSVLRIRDNQLHHPALQSYRRGRHIGAAATVT